MERNTVSLPQIEMDFEIPFHDVDLMEVMWHGHYAKYFEITRSALFDTFAYNYREMRDSGFAWPVIELKVRYAQPIELGQKIRVIASLVEYEVRLKTDYLVTDVKTGIRLTNGHTIQAAVDISTQELLFAAPPILLEKLGIKP
jgi:acyl-CoA thioester hydrolase